MGEADPPMPVPDAGGGVVGEMFDLDVLVYEPAVSLLPYTLPLGGRYDPERRNEVERSY
jgi:hypothetical protein